MLHERRRADRLMRRQKNVKKVNSKSLADVEILRAVEILKWLTNKAFELLRTRRNDSRT